MVRGYVKFVDLVWRIEVNHQKITFFFDLPFVCIGARGQNI